MSRGATVCVMNCFSFVFLGTNITIELRQKKNCAGKRESQGLHVLSHFEPFTGLVLSNSIHVRAADRPYVRVEWPCG